jgi:hypothetical protein
MKSFFLLLIIIILSLGLPLFFNMSKSITENYSNYTLAGAKGEYPIATDNLLVQDSYSLTGNKEISNNTAYDIWWHYPIFKVGSYAQITNNIKYSNNPDEGTCMPSSMCQTLYKEKQLESNYTYPLQPVNSKSGTRINYYTTDLEQPIF